jgi:hypothetical protein
MDARHAYPLATPGPGDELEPELLRIIEALAAADAAMDYAAALVEREGPAERGA